MKMGTGFQIQTAGQEITELLSRCRIFNLVKKLFINAFASRDIADSGNVRQARKGRKTCRCPENSSLWRHDKAWSGELHLCFFLWIFMFVAGCSGQKQYFLFSFSL